MIQAGSILNRRALGLLLAVAALLLSASCGPPPVTRTKTTSVPSVNLLVVSEMREEGSTLWAINPANIQDKRLMGSFPHQPGFPLMGVISPDGASIALVQLPPGADRFSGARLLIVSKDGVNQRALEEGIDYDILPVWSPDSRELVFVKRAGPAAAGAPVAPEAPPAPPPTEVYAIGADGKNRRLLFMDSQSLDLYLVGWHKDGKRIIYRRFTAAGDELWAFNLSNGQPQALSTLSTTPAYGVRISPDGTAVVASVLQDKAYNVVSQSLEGQSRKVLSKGNRRPSSPLFAPDGRRIAFDVEPPQQGAAVGIMDAGAETITRLSSPSGGKEIPLTFSPDGEWLLIRHSQDGRTRALLLRMKDGTKEFLDTAYWVEPIGWIKG